MKEELKLLKKEIELLRKDIEILKMQKNTEYVPYPVYPQYPQPYYPNITWCDSDTSVKLDFTPKANDSTTANVTC